MGKGEMQRDIFLAVTFLILGSIVYFFFPDDRTVSQPPVAADGSNSMSQNKTQQAQLTITVLKEGSGEPAQKGDRLLVHYTGTLSDGRVFDSSRERNTPFELVLGRMEVIPGWELGLSNMRTGEKRRLVIPPELAYGERGFQPVIPPNATLTFEVELLSINN